VIFRSRFAAFLRSEDNSAHMRADYCIPANAVFADKGKQRRKSQQSKGKPKKKRSLEAEQP
jgi:hypothetical protein